MATVFAFGVAVVDFVFLVEELPNSGMKYRAIDTQIGGGGMAASAAVAVARLGGDAHLGARVGSDSVGDMICSELSEFGVALEFIHSAVGGRSPYSAVMVDISGERQIVGFPGRGLVEDPAWLDATPKHDAFLADTSWPPGLQRTLQLAKRHDVPGIVDGERAVDFGTLSMATHLAFSSQGIMALTGEDSALAGIKSAAGLYGNWLCVTDGENGTYLVRNGKIDQIPAIDIEAVNTLGAGDVWHGAFALMLAEGRDEEEAVQFANASATLRCTRKGGRECYPTRDEVLSFLSLNS